MTGSRASARLATPLPHDQSEPTERAVKWTIFFGAISGVDNFVRPKLVGNRVGLSELVMFFALLGGLQVFGVLGIVLGPVVFAIAASILAVLSDRPRPGPTA